MENTYDRKEFFEKYSQMERSVKGLEGAGEWHELQKLLPDFSGKRVLDLGCGFGWHCRYAVEKGASYVLGLDPSENMLARAREMTEDTRVEYRLQSMEEYEYPENAFDVVISSLALHYVESFTDISRKVFRCLKPGGDFVFSAEHPVFTAYGSQDWYYDEKGKILHWPVDRYFEEGERQAVFLGETMVKYHRTLTTYIHGLLENGFTLTGLTEPMPSENMMELPGMKDELRRPMMLLISARSTKF